MTDSDVAFERFAQKYKVAAKAVGMSFEEADDDWAPMLFLELEDGNQKLMPLQYADDAQKNVVFMHLIPMIAQVAKPRFLALVQSAWQLAIEIPKDSSAEEEVEIAKGKDISEHPDRSEVLHLVVASKDRVEFWSAYILRDDENPPGLSDWELKISNIDNLEGRLAECVRRSFA